MLRQGFQVHHPVERGAAPALPLGTQLGSLARGPDADAVYLRIAHSRRVQRRAALGAECLCPLVAAFGRLYIDRRFPAEELEGSLV